MQQTRDNRQGLLRQMGRLNRTLEDVTVKETRVELCRRELRYYQHELFFDFSLVGCLRQCDCVVTMHDRSNRSNPP